MIRTINFNGQMSVKKEVAIGSSFQKIIENLGEEKTAFEINKEFFSTEDRDFPQEYDLYRGFSCVVTDENSVESRVYVIETKEYFFIAKSPMTIMWEMEKEEDGQVLVNLARLYFSGREGERSRIYFFRDYSYSVNDTREFSHLFAIDIIETPKDFFDGLKQCEGGWICGDTGEKLKSYEEIFDDIVENYSNEPILQFRSILFEKLKALMMYE